MRYYKTIVFMMYPWFSATCFANTAPIIDSLREKLEGVVQSFEAAPSNLSSHEKSIDIQVLFLKPPKSQDGNENFSASKLPVAAIPSLRWFYSPIEIDSFSLSLGSWLSGYTLKEVVFREFSFFTLVGSVGVSFKRKSNQFFVQASVQKNEVKLRGSFVNKDVSSGFDSTSQLSAVGVGMKILNKGILVEFSRFRSFGDLLFQLSRSGDILGGHFSEGQNYQSVLGLEHDRWTYSIAYLRYPRKNSLRFIIERQLL